MLPAMLQTPRGALTAATAPWAATVMSRTPLGTARHYRTALTTARATRGRMRGSSADVESSCQTVNARQLPPQQLQEVTRSATSI